MELKEFIIDTITQISEAVQEINGNATIGTVVNPKSDSRTDSSIIYRSSSVNETTLHFDVALSINSSEGNAAKVGVISGIFGLGANLSSNNENEALTRLTFNLSVLLPQG